MQNKAKQPMYIKVNERTRIAIVTSLYHEEITRKMEKSCADFLIQAGVNEKNIDYFYVPGSWEIPLVVQRVAQSKKYHGIVTFVVIIKGETYHFEMIANQCSQALMQISLAENTPVVFEVLATYGLAQAEKRASGEHNKGIEAAQALLKMLDTLSKIK